MTLGESVTDGVGSTPDTNLRWTNVLAERLQGHWATEDIAVLNAGIGGNRILHDIVGPSALNRLDRDVLVQSGATHLIVSPGNTDILIPDLIGLPDQNVSAEQIIQGHQQIITRARAMGLRVYGATLPPVEGSRFPASGRRSWKRNVRSLTASFVGAARTKRSSILTRSCAIPLSRHVCDPNMTAATMCTRTILAIARWRKRST